jgi:arylsulfatase
MHALPEDMAKYKGKYDGGFTPIRERRLERLKKLGLVSASTELTPATDQWEAVKDKPWEARNMEVYAAMVDRMDQGIGRIVAELKRQKQLDNTLIFYLQDNGGCAEGYGRYTPKKGYSTTLKPMGPDDLQKKIWPPMQTRDGRPLRTGPGIMAGPEDTFIGYGRGWANVSNTPFKMFKHWIHEGGISTPLIAHWPKGIAAKMNGKLVREPGHLIDIMATCVDVAGIDYPAEFGGQPILPMEGVSLAPGFAGKAIARADALYFEHHLNCGIRDGDWKLVRKGQPGKESKLDPWELYDMSKDRAEHHDLAAEHPEKVAMLTAKWEAWATRAKVKPWPWTFAEGTEQ